ncbi:MAG TPA: DUF2911 domain-containing protein [Longimicrobium sp.]|nr:DUF2911 domain-containing protein [Longimicrobium sp.]
MKILARTALAALALSLAAAPAAAQESGAYVVRLGRDTVLVEQFTRTADRIEGTIVGRSPRTAVRTYTATLRPDGGISRLEVVTRIPAAPDLLPQTLTVTMGADSAQWRTQRGDTVREGSMAITADATPWVGNAWGLAQPTIRAAQARGADSVGVPVVQAGARQTGTVSFIRKGADSLLVRSPNGVTRARVDAQGRVLGAHSPESTFKAEVERVASLDANAIAAAWTARDQAGQQVGSLSPRDSVAADINGANVSVAYGRPSLRGRSAVGGLLVPYGQVWRTGANEATHFRTDRDLMFGDTRVPAGSYTIWTVPAPEGWTVIFNRQTGQWGTVYDPAQDLARIPASADRAPGGPVEQFTMRFEASECGDGGTLQLVWENTRVSVPFTVAR